MYHGRCNRDWWLVGRASVTDKISMNSTPQQTEYKPIYSSLAIEQNTLDIYFVG